MTCEIIQVRAEGLPSQPRAGTSYNIQFPASVAALPSTQPSLVPRSGSGTEITPGRDGELPPHPPHRTGREQFAHPVPQTSLCCPRSPFYNGLLRTLLAFSDRVGELKVSPLFPPTEQDARLRLPSSGSPGHGFPTFSTGMLSGHRYYAQLRLPPVRLGLLHSSLASRYLACFLYLCPVSGSRSGRSTLHRPGLGQPGDPIRHVDKETNGSLKFLSYPCEYMPRSWTPVES